MPLPQQVIEQLSREPAKTPGWSFGALAFSGGILFLVLFVYFGITFGYEPYLNSQISSSQNAIDKLGQSVSVDDEAKLVNYASQITNLRTLIQAHAVASPFFAWLEKNTEANVYYQSLAIAPGGAVTLAATARTEGDVNQQLAIFESAPEVKSIAVSNVGASQTGSGWSFAATLTMQPSSFIASQ